MLKTERNMTSADVHIFQKNGKSINDLMLKFGFESEDDVEDEIRKMFKRGSSNMIKQLRKNGETKKHRRKDTKVEASQEMDEAITTQEETEELENDGTIASLESQPSKISLEDLQKQESEYSALLIEYEQKHKSCMQVRRDIVTRLQSVDTECNSLLQKVKELEATMKELQAEYEEATLKMAYCHDDVLSTRRTLQKVRKQIEEAKKVEIFVYKNGNFELEQLSSGEKVERTFEDLLEELAQTDTDFTRLLSMPGADEMTVRQLKTAINLQMIIKSFEEQGLGYSIIFEDEQLQKFYETMTL